MMYRVYKTEHFQKRPRWIIPLLLAISPRDFIQESYDGAVSQLDYIEKTINESKVLTKKNRYKVKRGDGFVSIVNESGTPYLSYRIESFKEAR